MTPKFDMIGLVVEDMARSLAFYRTLGWDIPLDADTDNHVEITLPNGLRFGWDTMAVIRSFDPAWTKPSGSNAMGLAFLCDSPAEVDKLHAALVDAGHQSKHDPWDAVWGQRYASILDPDDNVIDLFAPL